MHINYKSFGDDLAVVVVGASGGIGQALINELLNSDKVAVVYGLSRSPQQYDNPKYIHFHIDYEKEQTIALVVEQLPALDIVLVATGLLHDISGIQPEKSFRQLNSDDFLKTMLVNALGPSLMAKYLLPHMKTDEKTVFAALSARVGSISDNRLGGWYAYRASKAALNMMIKTLAIESARRAKQLIVVGLHPGTVDTDLSKPFQRNVVPEKLFTAEYSARKLLSVVDTVTIDDSGCCIAWDGKKVPA